MTSALTYVNFMSSTTTTAPLLIARTSLDSSGFSNLPTIAAPGYMWLVLDPSAIAGLPEIVQTTAHTAASTNVAIVRAQQSTVARQHLAGTTCRYSATTAYWAEVVDHGQFVAWTPTIIAGIAVTFTTTYARLIRVGRQITAYAACRGFCSRSQSKPVTFNTS